MKSRNYRLWLLIGLLAFLVLVLTAQFSPPLTIPPAISSDILLDRAAWVGVEWVMEPHTDEEIRDFASGLQRDKIQYAFLYTSYLTSDGTFNETFDYAEYFVSLLREAAPEILLLAWIGVPVQGQSTNQAVINRLEDPSVREQIATFAAMTVNNLGFDGIHLNAEPVPENDPAFLETLIAIRNHLPEGSFLSTTAHALRMTSPQTVIPYPEIEHHWSSQYLFDVATLVDQVALMAYDSGLPFPADYRRWLAYQVRESTAALAESNVALLLGIPTSEEWTPSHQTQAETLSEAINGLREGLAVSQFPTALSGIAVYPYWETDETEWQLIDSNL